MNYTTETSLGDLMKEQRIRLHLTQEKVAELIDCHPQYYKNLENGKGTPSLPLFCKIIRTLNLSADSYITPNNDQTDPDYQEMLQIFNQSDNYQRSVLLATGRALLLNQSEKKESENTASI